MKIENITAAFEAKRRLERIQALQGELSSSESSKLVVVTNNLSALDVEITSSQACKFLDVLKDEAKAKLEGLGVEL